MMDLKNHTERLYSSLNGFPKCKKCKKQKQTTNNNKTVGTHPIYHCEQKCTVEGLSKNIFFWQINTYNKMFCLLE